VPYKHAETGSIDEREAREVDDAACLLRPPDVTEICLQDRNTHDIQLATRLTTITPSRSLAVTSASETRRRRRGIMRATWLTSRWQVPPRSRAAGSQSRLRTSTTRCERGFCRIDHAARAHIAYEEQRVWPSLRAALPADKANGLGARLASEMQAGPTRPHPRTPPSPAVLKAAGRAVAAIDKLRDTASARDN
jgi:hypothetical protein